MLQRHGGTADIWQVDDFLSARRRTFEQKYDYRYSVLIEVLGRLLHEWWIAEADLAELDDEKVELIRGSAAVFRELGGPGPIRSIRERMPTLTPALSLSEGEGAIAIPRPRRGQR